MAISHKKNLAIELLELIDPTYKAVNFHPLDCDVVGVILGAKIKHLVKDMKREELTGNYTTSIEATDSKEEYTFNKRYGLNDDEGL